jgi:uncharacterized membrane protein YhaH (DUF805 family)
MKWFIIALKKYAVFNGRSQRKEYWLFVLWLYLFAVGVVLIVTFAIVPVLNSILFTATIENDAMSIVAQDRLNGLKLDAYNISNISVSIYFILMVIPTIAVSIRRLHDTNHSGDYFL